MRILLTGAGGRFGQAFVQAAAAAGHDVVPIPRDRLELPDALPQRPRLDWLVHAAGLTDVDACERDPALAMRSNGDLSGHLARQAAARSVRVAYVSTDYVFDGAKGNYAEGDPTGPVNAYGASKLEGERQVRAAAPDAIVARTSLVFGTPGRPDFVAWLAQRIQAQEPFPLVAGQRGSPTGTPDLALQVLALLETGANGTFHTAGADALDRGAMARTVAELMDLECKAEPVPMPAATWTAQRPRDSSLRVDKVRQVARPMAFRDAAAAYLEALA